MAKIVKWKMRICRPPGIDDREVQLMVQLAAWQGLSIENHVPQEIWVLGKTRGVPRPVLLGQNDETLAVGFFDMVDWLKREGLVRM